MNQTVKIRDLTGTEQTYSNIPYIKVKDSNAAEHIFINTSDANILASDVSVGATAYGSDGSLIQGTYDGGSTGVSINGIIAAYKVDAGENISAGDFVSFVNKALSYENSCSSAPSAILLEANKVFIAHSYGGNDRYLYSTIVTIDGTTMTSVTTQLSTVINSCRYRPSPILLEDNKVFIAHAYTLADYYFYGTIVTIDGTMMTPVTTQLSAVRYSCYAAPSAILLETNKVFIAHSYSTNEYLYGTIVTIDGTMMTPVTTQLSEVAKSCFMAPSAILLDTNKVFIAHMYASDRYLYGTIVTINGTTMTAVTTRLSAVTYSCYYAPSAILLEDNKVFIAHAYNNSNRYLYGTIVTISGTTMTPVTTRLSAVAQSCYNTPSAILLEDNKVFIAHAYSNNYYLYGTIVTISGTTMTAVTTQLSSVTYSCYFEPSAILLEDNKVFIAHAYTSDYKYLYGTIVTIDGTTIAVTSESTVKEHVKKDLITPKGIAAQSGAAGDTINCYTPPV